MEPSRRRNVLRLALSLSLAAFILSPLQVPRNDIYDTISVLREMNDLQRLERLEPLERERNDTLQLTPMKKIGNQINPFQG
jgi:hypothetical protein